MNILSKSNIHNILAYFIPDILSQILGLEGWRILYFLQSSPKFPNQTDGEELRASQNIVVIIIDKNHCYGGWIYVEMSGG